MYRKSDAMNLIPLDNNESLKLIMPVERDWTMTVYKKSSEPVTINMSDVPILTRAAKPKKMVNVAKGDFIAGISRHR